jgi:hypothetical protein
MQIPFTPGGTEFSGHRIGLLTGSELVIPKYIYLRRILQISDSVYHVVILTSHTKKKAIHE